MINHLSQNRLINESQHGFRHKKSCLTNLLEYLEYVVNQIDAGDPVDVIYLDFQKAPVSGACVRGIRDKRGYIQAFSFLPLYRQLDDFDPLTHQVQVQVQLTRCHTRIGTWHNSRLVSIKRIVRNQ